MYANLKTAVVATAIAAAVHLFTAGAGHSAGEGYGTLYYQHKNLARTAKYQVGTARNMWIQARYQGRQIQTIYSTTRRSGRSNSQRRTAAARRVQAALNGTMRAYRRAADQFALAARTLEQACAVARRRIAQCGYRGGFLSTYESKLRWYRREIQKIQKEAAATQNIWYKKDWVRYV